jgi:hypothetical protein
LKGALYVVVIEPSPFRAHETYVEGPFFFGKAKRAARKAVRKHPFGEARLFEASTTIRQGSRVLW